MVGEVGAGGGGGVDVSGELWPGAGDRGVCLGLGRSWSILVEGGSDVMDNENGDRVSPRDKVQEERSQGVRSQGARGATYFIAR